MPQLSKSAGRKQSRQAISRLQGLMTAMLTANRHKIFNKNLTQDPKKRIDASHVQGNIAACGVRDLVAAAASLQDQSPCNTRKGPWRERLERIIQAANKYAAVVDVMVQHQPHITALVWGAIRLLIGVSVCNFHSLQ
jgi:hypothetical protein